jgi:hypothetical protein
VGLRDLAQQINGHSIKDDDGAIEPALEIQDLRGMPKDYSWYYKLPG